MCVARRRETSISADIKAATDAFIIDPSPENEQALMLVADPKLLATRYRVVREACAAALQKMAHELRDIAVPILQRKLKRLEQELAAALEDEAKERAAIEARGSMFLRQVNGPVESLQRIITRTKETVAELNELRGQRNPQQLMMSL